MHRKTTKDEKAALAVIILYAIAFTVSAIARFDKDNLMIRIGLGILIPTTGYLFFNRTVKFLCFLLKNRKDLYRSACTITDTEYVRRGRGYATVYISEYTDHENKLRKEKIYRSISKKEWKVGDELNIRISRKDPEQIVIVPSDIFTAVFYSVLGAIFEIILITLFFMML